MHGALNQQINGSDKWCLTPFISCVILVLLTCLSCCTVATSAPAAKTAWQSFETIVNESFVISYRLPEGHNGFSPEPKKLVTMTAQRAELIAGFSYPSGWFDRVMFSTLYSINVQRFAAPIPDGVAASTFASAKAAESSRRRQESVARGAMFVPEPTVLNELVLDGKWWICNDVIRSGKGPNVSEIECSRPIGGDLVLYISALFGHTIDRKTAGYAAARSHLEEIAGTIAIAKR